MRRLLVVVAMVGLAACSSNAKHETAATSTTVPASTTAASATPAALPLGDGKYATTPTKGSVYSCITQFNGGGAFRDGPWIDSNAKTWDPSKKIAVRGSVKWEGKFDQSVSGATLTLTGNGLPTVATGTFPVAASDPAYGYDRNPNSIKGYTLEVKLPADPLSAAEPACVGGTIGISVLGAPIYSAFDALGRDAAAHEVQDACGGHPEITGQYHFHSLSPCLPDDGTGLFGYALDGFGIFRESGMTSADLDECHGRTSEVAWHGKKTSIYHYVATDDFPYLVACFKGTPITSATGLHIGPPR